MVTVENEKNIICKLVIKFKKVKFKKNKSLSSCKITNLLNQFELMFTADSLCLKTETIYYYLLYYL